MKKVIVKCKLKNRDEFEKKLSEIDMDFGPMYWLHDRVYVPRDYKKHSSYPKLVLRTEMRAVDRPAKYYLILRRHIEDSGVDIADRTVVQDYTEAANIILQLGFKSSQEVSRRRQEIVMENGVRMYLDKIDGMAGYYAKLEAEMTEDDKVEDLQSDLEHTFRVLGQGDFVQEAYSDLL